MVYFASLLNSFEKNTKTEKNLPPPHIPEWTFYYVFFMTCPLPLRTLIVAEIATEFPPFKIFLVN